MTITEPSIADRARLEQTRGLARASRGVAVSGFELRKAGEDSTIVTFTGHASVTGTPYEMYGGPDKGGWNEIVDPGAFKRTLGRGPDVAFLVNHTGMSMARTTKGTLHLSEDATGLAVRADLDTRNTDVNNLVVEMERGSIDEMSFAFRVTQQQWLNSDGEEVPWWDLSGIERHIQAVDLEKGDVSAVNYGASPHTSASLRSLVDTLPPVEAHELQRLCVVAAMSEKRAGMTLSAATNAVLQAVLDGMTEADSCIDDCLETLADLMGVENPDDNVMPADGGPMMQMSVHPDLITAQHKTVSRYAELRAFDLQ